MSKTHLAVFVLFIALNLGFVHSNRFAKFSLDEEIGEVVEILFGEDAQDDYVEFMHTNNKAKAAFKDASICLTSLNLTYERFTHVKHKRGYDYQEREICRDLLKAVSNCARPAVDAVKLSANDPSFEDAIETVYEAVNKGAEYLFTGFNPKLPDLLQEGFPECFIRRAGRQMAKCFPGSSSGYSKSRDYLIYHMGQRFFDSNNCRMVKMQTKCLADTLQDCSKKSPSEDIPIFRNLMNQFLNDLCRSEYHDAAATDGTSSMAFSWITLLLPSFLIKFW